MNSTRKYVLTRRGTHVTWENSTVIAGADPTDHIRDLTRQPGRDVAVSGSPTVVRWLLGAGLLDQLRLFVVPLTLGSGQRLFPEGSCSTALALARVSAFDNGVLDVTYRKADQ